MSAATRSAGSFRLITASARAFTRDHCGLRAAALCYYTIFALPPLLILLVAIAGLIWSPDAVQRAMESQFSGLVGAEGGRAVRDMVSSAPRSDRGVIALALGIGGLVFGATGAFLSLQSALNAVWAVEPDPDGRGVRRFITRRLLSFGMVMGVGFLIVVSLALTAALSAVGTMLGGGVVMEILNVLLTTVVLSVLFAAIFKYLPDAVVEWRSVWVGGVATAVLFEVGKFVIGLYLGHTNPGNAFGSASALAVILVWIYYAGVLVLFGAEFTSNFAQARGHAIGPKAGAVRVQRDERVVRP